MLKSAITPYSIFFILLILSTFTHVHPASTTNNSRKGLLEHVKTTVFGTKTSDNNLYLSPDSLEGKLSSQIAVPGLASIKSSDYARPFYVIGDTAQQDPVMKMNENYKIWLRNGSGVSDIDLYLENISNALNGFSETIFTRTCPDKYNKCSSRSIRTIALELIIYIKTELPRLSVIEYPYYVITLNSPKDLEFFSYPGKLADGASYYPPHSFPKQWLLDYLEKIQYKFFLKPQQLSAPLPINPNWKLQRFDSQNETFTTLLGYTNTEGLELSLSGQQLTSLSKESFIPIKEILSAILRDLSMNNQLEVATNFIPTVPNINYPDSFWLMIESEPSSLKNIIITVNRATNQIEYRTLGANHLSSGLDNAKFSLLFPVAWLKEQVTKILEIVEAEEDALVPGS